MKKTSNQKLRLGVFVVTGLLLFIVAIYFIGERQNLFNKTFNIGANFNNVNGLMEGNNVRYSGINVGTVKKITMYNDSTIHVSMTIDEKMVNHIKKDAVATIGTDGLVGNMIINIIPGEGNKEHIASGDVIQSYTKIGTGEMLNTLNVTNENAALLTSKLLDITNAITSGKGTLGMLINDTIAAHNVKQAIDNLRLTSEQATETLKGVNAMMSAIDLKESVAGVLVNDSIEAQKVRTMISNLEASSHEIKVVISNLNETLVNLKDGSGAINYLSNDEDFVNALEQTMKNIQESTDKFNQNMEALKHNFLTRSYFRKLEREARRSEKKGN